MGIRVSYMVYATGALRRRELWYVFPRLRDGIGIVPGENSVARVPMKEF